eukprot:6177300-Pyramimonas_sp.AAC.1
MATPVALTAVSLAKKRPRVVLAWRGGGWLGPRVVVAVVVVVAAPLRSVDCPPADLTTHALTAPRRSPRKSPRRRRAV